MMWRDDGMVLLLLWWWCGRPVGNTRLGEGVWANNAKPSCRSSVLGVLCETAVGDDAEGWWGGVDEVTVAAGSRVGLCKPGLWVWGAPLEIAVVGDGGRWWGGDDEVTAVVGLHIGLHK